MRATKRFDAWIQHTGVGIAGVAQLLGCSASYVSLLRNGHRTPSLATAVAIERLTKRAPTGPIRPADWIDASEAA